MEPKKSPMACPLTTREETFSQFENNSALQDSSTAKASVLGANITRAAGIRYLYQQRRTGTVRALPLDLAGLENKLTSSKSNKYRYFE